MPLMLLFTIHDLTWASVHFFPLPNLKASMWSIIVAAQVVPFFAGLFPVYVPMDRPDVVPRMGGRICERYLPKPGQ